MKGRLFSRRLALGGAAAVFLVIVASAWLRHTQAGLGCPDWPGCYGRLADVSDFAPVGTFFARFVHRLAASTALIVIAMLAFVTLKPKADYAAERRLAWVALALALGLAALGLATAGWQVPAVTLGNLLGGFALFATLAALAACLRDAESRPPPSPHAVTVLAAALVATFAHAALGGMIGAQFAATACPPALACPGADLATLAGSGILDPARPLTVVDGRVRAPAGADALVLMHRLTSLAVVALALLAAWTVRADRARAFAIAAFAVAALALGAVATLRQPALVATVGHNALAAALVAALAAALAAFRRDD